MRLRQKISPRQKARRLPSETPFPILRGSPVFSQSPSLVLGPRIEGRGHLCLFVCKVRLWTKPKVLQREPGFMLVLPGKPGPKLTGEF